jgi:DHA1 family tetracycline resistance protein-like MFS transporter
MSSRVSPTEQGQLQGANASLMGIANLLGPGLFTQIFALTVGVDAGWHMPGATYILAALLLVLAGLIGWRTTAAPDKIDADKAGSDKAVNVP